MPDRSRNAIGGQLAPPTHDQLRGYAERRNVRIPADELEHVREALHSTSGDSKGAIAAAMPIQL